MGTPAPNEPDPLPAFRRLAYLRLPLMALRVAGLPLLPELTPPGRPARSAAQRAGLTLELRMPGEQVALAPAVEQGRYRIAQEALESFDKLGVADRTQAALLALRHGLG